MEKIVYFSPKGQYQLKEKLNKEQYTIFYGNKFNDILIYMINNPDTMVFLYEMSDDQEMNRKVLEGIYQLNSLMPFMGVATTIEMAKEEEYKKYNPNYQTLRPLDDIEAKLKAIQKNRREYNRTEWPLSATFYLETDPHKTENGVVLSLSAGGAYIKTTNLGMVGDEKLLMEIKFKDFKFFVESFPVRVNRESIHSTPPGFAVEFVNVSHATKKYIKNIINDKILSNLLEAVDLENKT